MKGLLKNCEWSRVSNAVAAGTSEIDSSSVDMSNAEGVVFAVHFGTITAGAATSIKVQGSTDNSSFTDLEGTSITIADTDDNKIALTEVVNPQYRYLRCVVLRATQNAVVDSISALKHGLRHKPATQPSTVQASYETAAGPAAGTA